MLNILLIDDNVLELKLFSDMLQDMGYKVNSINSGKDALSLPENVLNETDVALIDLIMPELDGHETGRRLRRQYQHLVTVMLTGVEGHASAVEALRDHGFDDYITKSEALFSLGQTLQRAEKISQKRRAQKSAQDIQAIWRKWATYSQEKLIGQSAAFQSLHKSIQIAAKTDKNVIIQGETGTGKDLVARQIHKLSPRKEGRFLAVNCAAIPPELLESELFGHVKGAFTGAIAHNKGMFEIADKGTLFLDEIGDMPLALQTKLLRVLEEQKITPIGGQQSKQVDVRIICATHCDLQQLITKQQFRSDLYFRICVIPIYVPTLQERQEDIGLLAGQFLSVSDSSKDLSPKAVERLKQHDWPGNIRELKNAIDRAAAFAEHLILESEDFDFLEQASIAGTNKQAAGTGQIENTRPTAVSMAAANHDTEQLWTVFKSHNYKLWEFEQPEQLRHELETALKGACYVKKGHTGRLICHAQSDVNVNVRYICPTRQSIQTLNARFRFFSKQQPEKQQHAPTTPDFAQINVLKGLPETYLFNLLYPQNKVPSPATEAVQALLLRYALEYAPGNSLKKVFNQVMTFMIDQNLAHKVDGLRQQGKPYTGLDATRAYLCSSQRLFAGIASELKHHPDHVIQRICKIFPRYQPR